MSAWGDFTTWGGRTTWGSEPGGVATTRGVMGRGERAVPQMTRAVPVLPLPGMAGATNPTPSMRGDS